MYITAALPATRRLYAIRCLSRKKNREYPCVGRVVNTRSPSAVYTLAYNIGDGRERIFFPSLSPSRSLRASDACTFCAATNGNEYRVWFFFSSFPASVHLTHFRYCSSAPQFFNPITIFIYTSHRLAISIFECFRGTFQLRRVRLRFLIQYIFKPKRHNE